MGRRRGTSLWNMQFSSPPVIPLAKLYYRMHRLRLKRDERDASHGCGVIVGLIKK